MAHSRMWSDGTPVPTDQFPCATHPTGCRLETHGQRQQRSDPLRKIPPYTCRLDARLRDNPCLVIT